MVRLKICGIRSISDYELVSSYDVDYAGFVFAPSRRRVSTDQASFILENRRKDNDMKSVGVFVNPTLEEVISITGKVDLDVLQFHGEEQPRFIKTIRSVQEKEIWKALPHGPGTVRTMTDYADVVDGYVIDTKVEGEYGGTGKRFDWASIPTYTDVAARSGKKCFIAGGIKPENVTECIGYRPYGIDVSSGVENDAVTKDPIRLKKLLERMRVYESSEG